MSSRRRPQDIFRETSSRRLPGDAPKTSSRRRPQDIFKETSSRRLPGDAPKTSSRRRPQNFFQETSPKSLPGDVLKTSLKHLTTSRLLLVRAKDHLETIYGLSIYVRFKLLTYYHSITRQTNWINLNKLNTLKNGNNTGIIKTTVRLENTFSRSLNIFSVGVSHIVALLPL